VPELDHLTILAPSLAEGVAHVRARLGIDMPYGGAHPEMGTHNHLLRLGVSTFLEVIAVDPAAPPPKRPRWFGLEDGPAIRRAWDEGRRLGGWVARTGDLDALLARHGPLLGEARQVSRGDRHWQFAVPPDGSLPAGGAVPSVISWGERGCPAPSMPDLGAELLSFTLEHPDPDGIRALYEGLGLRGAPALRKAPRLRYRATVRTPSGLRDLD
jgi:hypothetical protein